MIYNVTSASYDSGIYILLPHEATKYFSEKLDLVWQNIKVSHSLFYKDWESMCPTYDIKGRVCIGQEKVISPYEIKINYDNGANGAKVGFYIGLYCYIPEKEPLLASFYFSVIGGYLSPAEWGKIKSDVLDKLQEKFQERERYFKRYSLMSKIKKEFFSLIKSNHMIKKFVLLFIITVVYNHVIEALIYYFKDQINAYAPLYLCCFLITCVSIAWNYFATEIIDRTNKKKDKDD